MRWRIVLCALAAALLLLAGVHWERRTSRPERWCSAADVEPSVVELFQDNRFRGSGFLCGSPPVVVTAGHVARAEGEYWIRFSDRTIARARLKSGSCADDIALLELDRSPEQPSLRLAESGDVGTPVVLVGQQAGRRFVASWGRVAFNGAAYEYQDSLGEWIPVAYVDGQGIAGVSGAPWVGPDGSVVAMSVGGFPNTIGGFAYVVEASRIRARLRGECPSRPSLRSRFADAGTPMRTRGEAHDLERGVMVVEPESDGPLGAAGVVGGDVVYSVNGRRCRDGDELLSAVESHRPGESLRLEIWDVHGKVTKTVDVTLAEARLGTRPKDEPGR